MLGSYSENISQTSMMECFEEIFNDFSFSAKYSILGVLGLHLRVLIMYCGYRYWTIDYTLLHYKNLITCWEDLVTGKYSHSDHVTLWLIYLQFCNSSASFCNLVITTMHGCESRSNQRCSVKFSIDSNFLLGSLSDIVIRNQKIFWGSPSLYPLGSHGLNDVWVTI